MKLNPTTMVLFVILAVGLLFTGVCGLRTYNLGAELRSMNAEIVGINNWRQLIQQLAIDCNEYSKKNPDIIPVIEPYFGKPPGAK